MEEKRINDDDLIQINGAGYKFSGKKAKVYAINGPQFGFYHSLNSNEDPYMMINNATEMEVNPVPEKAMELVLGFRKLEGYAALYADRVSFIRDAEVLIEWK